MIYVGSSIRSQVIHSTGAVVEPYFKYSKLLPTILTALKGEQSWNVRREIHKVLGILGAVDPLAARLKDPQIQAAASSSAVDENAEASTVAGQSSASEVQSIRTGGPGPAQQQRAAIAGGSKDSASEKSKSLTRQQSATVSSVYMLNVMLPSSLLQCVAVR